MGGKKSSGKHYTSKGERISSISTKVTDMGDKMLNKVRALKKGKDVWYTLDNPNKADTKAREVRVRVSGREWVRRLEGKAQ
jgi:hypothetical protein